LGTIPKVHPVPGFRAGLTAAILALAVAFPAIVGATQEGSPEAVLDSLRGEVERAEATGDPAELGRVLLELGDTLRNRELADEALEIFRAAVTPLELAGNLDGLARAHNSLGVLHWGQARYDDAVIELDRARQLWTDLGDQAALGRVYNNLGAAHYQWGNYAPAMAAFLRARDLRRATGDRRGEALVLANIGRTYHDWEQYARARSTLEQGVAVAEASGDAFALAYVVYNLAIVEVAEGRYPEARDRFEASLELYASDAPGMTPGDAASGWALNTLGIASSWVREGDPQRAIPLLEEALTRARTDGNTRRELRALVQLGEAQRLLGNVDLAAETLAEALVLSREVEQRTLALETLEELSNVHEARGAHAEALSYLRAYDALRDSIFSQGAAQRVVSMEAQAQADRQERENTALREAQRVQEAVIARQRLVFVLGGSFLAVSLILLGVLVHYNRVGRNRERLLAETNAALEDKNRDLREALAEVRTLEGLIPICVHCKNVRDDQGFWEGVETYVSSRSAAHFSHSICAECGPKIYGEDWAPGAGEDPEGSEPDAPRATAATRSERD
jgi:tetratricopeptide (TPR) repeat protein